MLDDRVKVIAGLRRQSVNVTNYAYTGEQSAKFERTKLTPAYGLVVKPWEHISLYANHIEALQAGETAGSTYNSGTVVNGGQVTGIETSKQNEVGVKADYGRIAGSLAVFEIKNRSRPIAIWVPATAAHSMNTATTPKSATAVLS
ncbi:Ferrichrome receptor FcuA [Sodalis praecaptivus]